MTRHAAGAIGIEAESFGDPARPCVLLIMGLGMQLTAWPMPLVDDLVAAGHRVVRFDNRDAGLSTQCNDAPRVNVMREVARYYLRLPLRSSYTIRTMADDTAALMDAMDIERAHVVGVSMGGMIAQTLAATRPERVITLASIMSSSGRRALPTARWSVLKLLFSPPPRGGFDARVEHFVRIFRALGGPGFPIGDDELRERTRASVQRAYRPAGTTRQLLAIAASGDRSADLAAIRAPTLVLHGDADPLLPVAHGRDCAARIAGATLRVVPGMGHDLPPTLLPLLRDALLAHFRGAQG